MLMNTFFSLSLFFLGFSVSFSSMSLSLSSSLSHLFVFFSLSLSVSLSFFSSLGFSFISFSFLLSPSLSFLSLSGYGEIFPVTPTGKVVCILYAMVGIPLMLLVITDFGDILAILFSKGYRHLHSSCKRLSSRICRPREKPQEVSDGTYIFRQEVASNQKVSIHASLRQTAEQLLNNMQTFDRIVEREQFEQMRPLARSCSCPQLNQMPPPPVDFNISHFMSIGQEMDRFNVPFLVILLVVFTYMLCWAHILPLWETDFNAFDAFYFCFITLTTIGFGDIVPKHPKFFLVTFLFIIMGMAIMSMAFKLGQSRIVCCYRRLMRCISCPGPGRAGKYDVQGA